MEGYYGIDLWAPSDSAIVPRAGPADESKASRDASDEDDDVIDKRGQPTTETRNRTESEESPEYLDGADVPSGCAATRVRDGLEPPE
ncbi:hypothetical protein F503_08760 [Ophiostoma piceae UAMH 11346]|uniref:Uncharacterized protein n=1 Tax=Ophiostoma piceae (strain UAMH 11346) TaxID=1262450 RepID=S3CPL4_OPHP1|nr:hypothetical protein F503_08760 [Ophiostoma piceae UAMH 11346]